MTRESLPSTGLSTRLQYVHGPLWSVMIPLHQPTLLHSLHRVSPSSSTVRYAFNILNVFFHVSLTCSYVVLASCPLGPMQSHTKIKPHSASFLRASSVLNCPTVCSFQNDLVLEEQALQPTASPP